MMTQPQTGTNRFRLKKRVFLVIPLVIVTLVAVFAYIYYSMGVASVTSISLDQIQAVRIFGNGNYPNRNATYFIEVQVWSKAEALSVRLDNPVFEVNLSPLVEGNQTLPGGMILAGSYLTYNLRLMVDESRDIGTVSFPNATVFVQMTTHAATTPYSQTVTARDSALWDWNTARRSSRTTDNARKSSG